MQAFYSAAIFPMDSHGVHVDVSVLWAALLLFVSNRQMLLEHIVEDASRTQTHFVGTCFSKMHREQLWSITRQSFDVYGVSGMVQGEGTRIASLISSVGP